MRPSPPLVLGFYGVILILIGRPNWVLVLGECLLVIAVVVWAVRFVRGFRGGKPSKVRIARKATTSANEPLGEAIRSSGPVSPVSEEAMSGAYTRLDAARSVVEASFEDESAEYIENYLAALRSNWQALTATISRTGLLLVALMTIFYLLTTPGAIGSVSLGPFEIDDPLIIQKSIPIVVAYLYYELALMGHRWDYSRDLFRLLMEQQHPKIYDNNVEVFLQPRMISLIGQTDHSYRFLGTQVKFVALHQLVSGFIVPLLISFVLPVAFEIAAYTYLLRRGADLFTVGGAVLSGMIVILTLSLGYVTTWVPTDAGPLESSTR